MQGHRRYDEAYTLSTLCSFHESHCWFTGSNLSAQEDSDLLSISLRDTNVVIQIYNFEARRPGLTGRLQLLREIWQLELWHRVKNASQATLEVDIGSREGDSDSGRCADLHAVLQCQQGFSRQGFNGSPRGHRQCWAPQLHHIVQLPGCGVDVLIDLPELSWEKADGNAWARSSGVAAGKAAAVHKAPQSTELVILPLVRVNF